MLNAHTHSEQKKDSPALLFWQTVGIFDEITFMEDFNLPDPPPVKIDIDIKTTTETSTPSTIETK